VERRLKPASQLAARLTFAAQQAKRVSYVVEIQATGRIEPVMGQHPTGYKREFRLFGPFQNGGIAR
jgi:hypothetical protein